MIQSFTDSFSGTPSQKMYGDIISQRGDAGGVNGPGSFADYLRRVGSSSGGLDAERRNNGRMEAEDSARRSQELEDRRRAEAEKIEQTERAKRDAEAAAQKSRESRETAEEANQQSGKSENEGGEKQSEKAGDAEKDAPKAGNDEGKADKGKAEQKSAEGTESEAGRGSDGAEAAEAAGKQAAQESKKGQETDSQQNGKKAAARTAEAESAEDRAAENEDKSEKTKSRGNENQKVADKLGDGKGGEAQSASAEAAAEHQRGSRAEQQNQSETESAKNRSKESAAAKDGKKTAKGSQDKGKLSVIDLRSKKEVEKNERAASGRRGFGKAASKDGDKVDGARLRAENGKGEMPESAKPKIGLKEELTNAAQNGRNLGQGGSSELSDDKVQMIRVDTGAQGGTRETVSWGSRSGKAEQSLLRQLREQLNGQIVKKSGIVVRDNGRGEIRLNLKPDHLGSVRIRISLEDNHIAGKIFVENSNIREVFDQNMQSLQRAFKEHGYESTSLEVSVGDGKQHQKGGAQGRKGDATAQAVQSLEDHVPEVGSQWSNEQIVDLVV